MNLALTQTEWFLENQAYIEHLNLTIRVLAALLVIAVGGIAYIVFSRRGSEDD